MRLEELSMAKKNIGKVINIGAIENGKSISTADSTISSYTRNITKVEGNLYSSVAGASWPIPNQDVECHISGPNIWLKNLTGFNINSGKLFMYYTKD